MLVLSRKVGESIVLPDCDATISVIAVYGQRVRLGIVAPKSLSVLRNELWVRMCEKEPQRSETKLLPPSRPR
ncbi:MAG: carbon storage regulator [Pirellulales bacterium]